MNMIMTSEHKENGHDHKDGHEQKHTIGSWLVTRRRWSWPRT